jgi:hypothetical protein
MFVMSFRMYFVTNSHTNKGDYNVGFEVLIAVVMKNSIFWNIKPCNLLKMTASLV